MSKKILVLNKKRGFSLNIWKRIESVRCGKG